MCRICLLATVFLLVSFICKGQQNHQYNLTIYNGLPSNHVYYAIKDSYGYLWMATTQGVVRYNGYSSRIYNSSDGLSNSDVWYLFEDSRKRIWLSSLSTEFGYIRNGKYKKAYNMDTDARMFPAYITNTNDGLIFCNYCRKSNLNAQVYIEHNDTLYNYNLPFFLKSGYYINNKNEVYTTDSKEKKFYKLEMDGLKINVKYNCSFTQDILNSYLNTGEYLYSDYLIKYAITATSNPKYYNTYLDAYSFRTCLKSVLKLAQNGKEHLTMMEAVNNILYIITDKNIYSYDSLLHPLRVIPNTDLINDKKVAGSIIGLLDDGFWNRCVATTTHGIYIDFGLQDNIKKVAFSFPGYTYAGQSADFEHFWWNKQENRIIIINSKGEIYTRTYHEFAGVKVIPYNTDSSLFLANDNIFWYNNRSKKISSFLEGVSITFRRYRQRILLYIKTGIAMRRVQ
jgi:ligand-binding sensor domain-containing protein